MCHSRKLREPKNQHACRGRWCNTRGGQFTNWRKRADESRMTAIVRYMPLLALLLVLAPICARNSAGSQGAPPSATIPASEQENLEPTVDYPSLDAARDSIGAMVHRSVNYSNPAVRVNAGRVRFKYLYAPDSVDGWAFHIAVTDTSCPYSSLEKGLVAAGWAPFYGYMADGPDGAVLGFVSKHYLCVVEGRWDGEDDSDSTYVAEPGCEVKMTCVPRREDDVWRKR